MPLNLDTQVSSTDLIRFLRDCNAFVASSREAIQQSAPHIYLSALPFAGKRSLVYQSFSSLLTGKISVRTSGIDSHGGRLVMTLTGHTRSVNSVAYLPDGHLASGSDDETVRIWDTQTGDEKISSLKADDGVLSVAISPTGKRLAAGTRKGFVCIWTIQLPLQPPQRVLEHQNLVVSVVFSPDDRRVASASWDRNVCLCMAETGQLISVMSGHVDYVSVVAFSPGGDILASGSYDNTVRFWDGRSGEPSGIRLLNHDSMVVTVCFSLDGTKIFAGLWNCTIQVWDMGSKTAIRTLSGQSLSIHFPGNGRLLVATGSWTGFNNAQLWYLDRDFGDASSVMLRGHSGFVSSAAFSSDSQYVATSAQENTIRIWDARDDQTVAVPLPAHNDMVYSLAVSADGAYIASGSRDKSVRVWDAQTGEPMRPPLLGHAGFVRSVAISQNARIIASGGQDDNTARLWDVHTGQTVGEIPGNHSAGVKAVALSPDTQWLAVGTNDGDVQIWDVATYKQSNISPLRYCPWLTSLTFSPDGGQLAAGDRSCKIHLWNMKTGQRVCEPLGEKDLGVNSFSISFSPTGTHIVGGAECIGQVWDIGMGKLVLALEGHSRWILSVSYSPDGLFIATGASDCTVRLWDAVTGNQISILFGHISDVNAVAFIPDGQSLVSVSDDSTIRVWDIAAAPSRTLDGVIDLATVAQSKGFKDGWLLGDNEELLLWVPEDYRANLQLPSCKLLIAEHRVEVTTPDDWRHGDNWTECWLGPSV